MKEDQWKMKGKPIQTEKQNKKSQKNPSPIYIYNIHKDW